MSTESFGNILAKIRKNNKLQQQELAKEVGISKTYLSQIEKGNKVATKEILERITKRLGVPLGFIHLLSIQNDEVPLEKLPSWGILTPVIKTLCVSIFPEELKNI